MRSSRGTSSLASRLTTVSLDIANCINDKQIYFQVARGENMMLRDNFEYCSIEYIYIYIYIYLIKMGLIPTLQHLVCRF